VLANYVNTNKDGRVHTAPAGADDFIPAQSKSSTQRTKWTEAGRCKHRLLEYEGKMVFQAKTADHRTAEVARVLMAKPKSSTR